MTFLRMKPFATFLLFLGGVLQAQSIPLERAWLSVVVPAKVEVQVMDSAQHLTGLDFITKKVVTGLPDSNYDPYEAIDDDVTGAPDPDPIQELDLAFVKPQKYTLRVHPTVVGTFRGELIVSDKKGKSRRIKFVTVAKKDLKIQEYWLYLDPMNVSKCHLEPIKR